MKFEILKDEEFDKYAAKSEQASFHQNSSWGKLKSYNGWNYVCLGLKSKNKIMGATLLLSKKLFANKKIFYAPRGFLIDYNNYDLLKEFTYHIKKYAKDNDGIFIKIDPYVSYQERDIDGNIVLGGKNNKTSHDNLLKLGYKHNGFNIMQEDLQPRWIFITPTKNKTMDEIMSNMDPKTRQIIHHNEKLMIRTREIKEDEIDKFKSIMQHTSERRGFIDRPISYYQEMYDSFKDKGMIKILLAELHSDELIKSIKNDIDSLKNEIKTRKEKFEENPEKMNKKKYENKQKLDEQEIERLNKRLDEIVKLNKEDGDVIVLGGILFFVYGNEVLSLVGGSYDKYMKYQSAYTVHFAGLKYALENNYDRYNFYGITGDFSDNNPLNGLYIFKRGYGGKVVELLGEYNLIVSPTWNNIYNIAFKAYQKLKKIRTR